MSAKRYTQLCLNCLKTLHGNACPCGGDLINLGDRKKAEWISQVQGNRRAILEVFDNWNYQSSYVKDQRFLVWLHGFELQPEIKLLHPDRWDKLVRLGMGFNYSYPVSVPYSADSENPRLSRMVTERWLIDANKRYKVELASA